MSKILKFPNRKKVYSDTFLSGVKPNAIGDFIKAQNPHLSLKAADAMALFEKFEVKLTEMNGNLQKSVVEMAKDWRMDKVLKELDALLAIMDNKSAYLLSGSGDVIEPDDQIISIGSGSGFAVAAARAYIDAGVKNPSLIVKKAMKITSDLCIYTNDNITILEA